jgi:hypothetical protein
MSRQIAMAASALVAALILGPAQNEGARHSGRPKLRRNCLPMRRAKPAASWLGYTPPARNKVCSIEMALCKLFVAGKDPKTDGEIFGHPTN